MSPLSVNAMLSECASDEETRYSFTPRAVKTKVHHAWERKPSTPLAARSENRKIWKRYDFPKEVPLKPEIRRHKESAEKRSVKKMKLDGYDEVNGFGTKWDEGNEGSRIHKRAVRPSPRRSPKKSKIEVYREPSSVEPSGSEDDQYENGDQDNTESRGSAIDLDAKGKAEEAFQGNQRPSHDFEDSTEMPTSASSPAEHMLIPQAELDCPSLENDKKQLAEISMDANKKDGAKGQSAESLDDIMHVTVSFLVETSRAEEELKGQESKEIEGDDSSEIKLGDGTPVDVGEATHQQDSIEEPDVVRPHNSAEQELDSLVKSNTPEEEELNTVTSDRRESADGATNPVPQLKAIEPGVAVPADDDTALLQSFLSKAKAKRAAANATTASVESPDIAMALSTDGASDALSPLEENMASPSPRKRQKVDAGEMPASGESPVRRSKRTSGKLLKSSNIQSISSSTPNQIPVLRRPNGTEFVFLTRTEAQEIALATRNNTRKNKGLAKEPKLRVQEFKETVEAGLDPKSPSPKKKKAPKPSAKQVAWADTLVCYERDEDAPVMDAGNSPKKRRSSSSSTKSTKEKTAGAGASMSTNAIPTISKSNKKKTVTIAPPPSEPEEKKKPSSRRAKRLTNGTPVSRKILADPTDSSSGAAGAPSMTPIKSKLPTATTRMSTRTTTAERAAVGAAGATRKEKIRKA